jgi:S1-C subfamily serine protease
MTASAEAQPAAPAEVAGVEWYYLVGQKTEGPIAESALRKLLASGQLGPDDLVWNSGMPTWAPISRVPALAARISQAPQITSEPARKPREAVRPRKSSEEIPVATATPSGVERPGGRKRGWLWAGVAGAVCLVGLLVGTVFLVRYWMKPAPLRELSAQEIVAKCEPGVALIRTARGNGTGFLIRPGLLVTNAHVIADAPIEQLKITFPSDGSGGKRSLSAKALLFQNRKRDLAFLSLSTDRPHLALAPRYKFERGQSVTAIGNPGVGGALTLENAVSRGVMSTQTQIDGQDYFQLNLSINPGNSGGPVIDAYGQVIGVIVAKARKEEAIALCIPWHDLQEGIAKAEAATPEASAEATSKHNLTVVSRRVSEAARAYLAGMSANSKSAADAIRRGQRASDAVTATTRALRPKLDQINHLLLEDVRAAIPRVTSDKRVSAEARARITELWGLYREAKGWFEAPRGTYNEYSKKTLDLSEKRKSLVDAIKLAVGTEELDKD